MKNMEMNIILKDYYTTDLRVVVTPSDWNIGYGFINKADLFQAKLPVKFYGGVKCEITCNCLCCKKPFVINDYYQRNEPRDKSTYLIIEKLSLKKRPDSMSSIMNIFKKLRVNKYGDVCLEVSVLASFFYQKCTHCEAQYLATFDKIYGQPSERTNPPTPDELYIEEMAWVEFDEQEFFMAMKSPK